MHIMARSMLLPFLAVATVAVGATRLPPPLAFAPSAKQVKVVARSRAVPAPLFASSDMDEEERRFLYGARGEEDGSSHSKGENKQQNKKKKEKDQKSKPTFLFVARDEDEEKKKTIAETLQSALGIFGDNKKEKTPAEKHKEAVAASQAEARMRRGEGATPAERHKLAVAASQAEARRRRGEATTPAERHRQAVAASQTKARLDREERQKAAKSVWDNVSESFASAAQAFTRTDDDFDFNPDQIADSLPPSSSEVDPRQLNKLLVHADKILRDDERALELLGGEPVKSLPDCRVLSQSPSYLLGTDGRRAPTEGIRAFLEVKGPKRSGMATIVGDKGRGVVLLKLTVGGQVVELRNVEGVDDGLASYGITKGLKP